MIININTDNTETKDVYDADGNKVTVYKYRPFIIVYMGPETNETNSTVRQSQPVVLNLNENFNGILYAPNSPVIINGNNHKLTGFVIAKEYLFLKTDDDFINEGYLAMDDGYGHTIFVKEDNENLLTNSDFDEMNKNNEYNFIFDAKRTLSVYTPPPEVDETYTKTFKKYRGLTDDKISIAKLVNEDGCSITKAFPVAKDDLSKTKVNDNYVKILVNTTEYYIDKTKLPYVKIYRNKHVPYIPICDLKLKKPSSGDYAGTTLVKDDTPDELDANAAKSYFIGNKDSKYVLRTLTDYPQNGYEKTHGADMIDKVIDDEGCKYFTFKSDTSADPVKYLIIDGEYLVSEESKDRQLIDEYRIITRELEDGTTEVRYIKEDSTDEYNENGASYYMKVTESGTNNVKTTLTPPIIVDNKGDLQTKRLTPTELFDYDTVSENMSLRELFDYDTVSENMSLRNEMKSDTTSDMDKYWNIYTRETNANEQPSDSGQTIGEYYRGLTGYRTKKEYKIPAFERVYYKGKDTFNLSENSMYSYFNIDDLVRVNYLYMNVDELNHKVNSKDSDKWKVDDMFFTTRRASWID